MRLLVVAPGLHPPWTEGRKNFLRDLLPLLQEQCRVHLLSTAGKDGVMSSLPGMGHESCAHSTVGVLAYSRLASRLLRLISELRPDVVLHFPFGTFDGPRGLFNRYSIRSIHRTSARAGVPCLTILYSMTGGDLHALAEKAAPLACTPTHEWSGLVVHPGIRTDAFPLRGTAPDARRLLFMAGGQPDSSRYLDYILKERGLMEILNAGEMLAGKGFRLSIAIPLLRYPGRLAQLRMHLARLCPQLPVELHHEVKPQELLSNHGIYLFPYRRNLRAFIPTSVIEAMAMGVPVLLSALPMFRPLLGDPRLRCASYSPGDPASLARETIRLAEHWDETVELALARAHALREQWDVACSARQVLELAERFRAGTA